MYKHILLYIDQFLTYCTSDRKILRFRTIFDPRALASCLVQSHNNGRQSKTIRSLPGWQHTVRNHCRILEQDRNRHATAHAWVQKLGLTYSTHYTLYFLNINFLYTIFCFFYKLFLQKNFYFLRGKKQCKKVQFFLQSIFQVKYFWVHQGPTGVVLTTRMLKMAKSSYPFLQIGEVTVIVRWKAMRMGQTSFHL